MGTTLRNGAGTGLLVVGLSIAIAGLGIAVLTARFVLRD